MYKDKFNIDKGPLKKTVLLMSAHLHAYGRLEKG